MAHRRLLVILSGLLITALVVAVGLASAIGAGAWSRGGDAVLIEALAADVPPPTSAPATPIGPGASVVGVDAAPSAEATSRDAEARPQQAAPAPTARTATPVASAVTVGGSNAIVAEAIRRWGRGGLLLAIPRIGVTAAVSGIGFEADGRTPATPTSAWGVGWYQFTAYPGTGGNAVLSGHVDWYTGAPAVFASLGAVGAGDAIYAVLPDGTPLAYQVGSVQWVRPAAADVRAVFGPTGQEALTLITCGGAWDPVAKDYSHRLIVRAYRVR